MNNIILDQVSSGLNINSYKNGETHPHLSDFDNLNPMFSWFDELSKPEQQAVLTFQDVEWCNELLRLSKIQNERRGLFMKVKLESQKKMSSKQQRRHK